MSRYIKLLPGERASQSDVSLETAGRYVIELGSGETDVAVIDCARWLDSATIASAVSTDAFVSVATSSPNITLTINGADSRQDGKITITASDGRIRIVRIATMQREAELLGFEDWY